MTSDPKHAGDALPAEHSDNEKSKLPERDDDARNQGPNDRPGKKPGEGEPDVG
ncbi:FIG00454714: hypothetical protein [Caballeronia glathei]|uniref:hypothetical protein n=1 Tax=Caballeronia glathei TaxID=60547 RepID=UPI000507A8DE|nr:hypothetical protein [Caballeronia glathei]CDY74060.1 FIG00454714: hypothetical protein [Caballeronia glathei]